MLNTTRQQSSALLYTRVAVAALVICLLSGAIYFQSMHFGLVMADDIDLFEYMAHQPDRFWHNTRMAFTEMPGHVPYWIPVSMASYFADYELFRMDPGGYHLTSGVLHGITATVFFVLLFQMTGCFWKSVAAAAIWAVHPLHTESVAWIPGRAGVLSVFWTILAVMAYVSYTKTGRWWKSLLACLFFILGLLSKPAIILFPVFLLLLDYWPLQRIIPFDADRQIEEKSLVSLKWLIIEKLPIAAIGAGAVLFGRFFFQATSMAQSMQEGSFQPELLLNIPVVYVTYLWKTLVPSGLPAYVPPMAGYLVPLWQIMGAFTIITVVTLAVIRFRKKAPYLLVGWGWFLIGLAPFLPVCVGQHRFLLQRYAYLPVLGLVLGIVWGCAALMRRLGLSRCIRAVAAVAVVAMLTVISHAQTRHWADSLSFFRHAVEVRPACSQTRANYGEVLFLHGRNAEAIGQLEAALAVDPNNALAHYHLGRAMESAGNSEAAMRHFEKAVYLQPDHVPARNSLGNLLCDTGRIDEAIVHYQNALAADPSAFMVYNNLATALTLKGDYEAAGDMLKKALAIHPGYATARENLMRIERLKAGR
ncbi:TPR repeat-containing protein [Desulfosudis oleivorans Hxd3]|uniref:TPR repeat-containing protein n=2 Tax=Desulfosudis TaxID=2904716 RepID=A8ZWU8_DESOH|nr:TPR repeat-containing protein [Desulfosudis oleivorans Hxd3]